MRRLAPLALASLALVCPSAVHAQTLPASPPVSSEAPNKTNKAAPNKAEAKKAAPNRAEAKKTAANEAKTAQRARKGKPFKRIPGVRYVKAPLRIGTSWDFQAEIGVVVNKVPVTSRRFFGRVRFGFLWAREPWIIALGAVMDGSGIPSLAWGLQAEVTHLWRGLWAQATITMDEDAKLFSALSAGFSLLGFEWQRRLSDGGTATNGYLIKLRVPIGIIFFAK